MYTFRGCHLLSHVTLPTGITYIGDEAFGGCSSLTTIVSKAIDAPELHYNAFSLASKFDLYVPAESVDAYLLSSWKDYFKEIIAN